MTNNKNIRLQTWVIKIGSSVLTAKGAGLDLELVGSWVDDIVQIHASGVRVVLVSSGAVAEGMTRLGLKSRPHSIDMLQAAAAVGQMGLIQMYESHFQRHGLHTAQVLLTHEDLRSRERYLNARKTLENLILLGVIPVVNENDTVVTDEIRVGDNDTLAALVANLIGADLLVLLTDQEGLFDGNPDKKKDARLIEDAVAEDTYLDTIAGAGGALGRGGMATKVMAARIAARSGANTTIASGHIPHVIGKLAAGKKLGTTIRSSNEMLAARKQWLAGLPATGRVVLDAGARRVIEQDGRSLLPVGVLSVSGIFTRGENVACVDEKGIEFARGLVNYSHEDAARICGIPSSEIEAVLGYSGEKELIHRDNLVIG